MQRILVSSALLVIFAAGALAEEVSLDGLTSKIPASWKQETPSSLMRAHQLRLPRAKDDEEDAELVIFKGLGGYASANIARWKKLFKAPEGKTIDDVAKVERIKIGGKDAVQLTIEGTYLFNPAPFNPASKPEARSGYKMIAIHFEGPKEVYHIKLTGPAKTVEKHQKDFEVWIKGKGFNSLTIGKVIYKEKNVEKEGKVDIVESEVGGESTYTKTRSIRREITYSVKLGLSAEVEAKLGASILAARAELTSKIRASLETEKGEKWTDEITETATHKINLDKNPKEK